MLVLYFKTVHFMLSLSCLTHHFVTRKQSASAPLCIENLVLSAVMDCRKVMDAPDVQCSTAMAYCGHVRQMLQVATSRNLTQMK